ncbi:MAG TPA: PTS sugar transporter subunit IIA [Acetobacteraceae bacterium]|nr:PTS sugar transporter subunit IIA [Acetobacteraceae bacterium]
MTIGDLIGPDQVVVGLRVADKAQLLTELSRRAATALSLPQPTLLQALQAREQLGSTGLGRGFALPHARLPGLPRVFVLVARLARPIDFEAVDDKPVDLVALLLTPDSAANQHLATLAALSRPFRDEAFVQQVRKSPDAAAMHRLLTASAS